jgi:hypothetical protein
MTSISLHIQWPLTSQLHGSVSQREQLFFFVTDQTPLPYTTRSLPAQSWHRCMEWSTVWVLSKPLITGRKLAWLRFEPGSPKWHTGALSTTPRAHAPPPILLHSIVWSPFRSPLGYNGPCTLKLHLLKGSTCWKRSRRSWPTWGCRWAAKVGRWSGCFSSRTWASGSTSLRGTRQVLGWPKNGPF